MSTGVCVIRTATPSPTQVAFEYPRARRIRLRSPPYWAATSAAKPRTKAALAGSRSSSSGCVSVVGSFIVGAPDTVEEMLGVLVGAEVGDILTRRDSGDSRSEIDVRTA